MHISIRLMLVFCACAVAKVLVEFAQDFELTDPQKNCLRKLKQQS